MDKLGKKVDELLDSLKKDQSMFAMCCNDEGDFFYAFNATPDEIGAGIAAILSEWFENKEENSERAAQGILKGILAVIMRGGKTGDAVMRFLGRAAAERTLENIKQLRDLLEDAYKDKGDDNGDDKDEEDEDCEHCDINRTCSLPSAIKYRKANGIPAPKKRANKRCNDNEQGS